MAWGNSAARQAHLGDLDRVLELLRLARAESPLGPHLCTPDRDRLTEQLTSWFALDNTQLIITENGERIIGIALSQFIDVSIFADQRFLQIEAIFVHPDFRRRGAGRVLMHEIAQAARRLDAEQIVTIVLTGARSEQRFLSGLGFGPAGSRRIVDTATLLRRLESSKPRHGRRSLDELIARRRRSRELSAHDPSGEHAVTGRSKT